MRVPAALGALLVLSLLAQESSAQLIGMYCGRASCYDVLDVARDATPVRQQQQR